MLGSVLGGLFGGEDQKDVDAIVQQMIDQYSGIVGPDLAKAIVYTAYQQGGNLTPEQLSSLPIEAQEAILLKERPEARARQEQQLSALEQLAATGLGPQELLAMETARRRAGQEAQARQQSLLQKYQQMGQGGSTASLMAQLQAGQQTSQDEMLANMQAAAMAAENRRSAIQAAMSGASQLRQQDLAVDQSNVEAKRQRQMFDIQNSINRQQTNAQMAQQANIMNLQRQQQIMDMNNKMANEEAYRRNYLAPQQMFQNQMALAQARAGALGTKATLAQQQNQAAAQSMSSAITGFGQLGMGIGQLQLGQDYLAKMGGNALANTAANAGANVAANIGANVAGAAAANFAGGAPGIRGRGAGPLTFENNFQQAPNATFSMPSFGGPVYQPQYTLGQSPLSFAGGPPRAAQNMPMASMVNIPPRPNVNFGQSNYMNPWAMPQYSSNPWY